MRQGFKNGFVKSDSGVLSGMTLGADHVAEHEWDIKGLKRAFGLSVDTDGVGRGYGLPQGSGWIHANGEDRRLLSGESCIQRRGWGP